MLPLEVGRRVVDAMRHEELYIMTHPELRPITDHRSGLINAGWEAAAKFDSSRPGC